MPQHTHIAPLANAAAAISLRMEPGETEEAFIKRCAAAHGPLSGSEIVQLRAIFQPDAPVTQAAAPPQAA